MLIQKKSYRLNQCLIDAGIQPNLFAQYLQYTTDHPNKEGIKTSKEEFEFGLCVIQAKRLIDLISPEVLYSPLPES